MGKRKVSYDEADYTETAAMVWLLIAGVVALLLYLSSLYVRSGKEKKRVVIPTDDGGAVQRAGGRRRIVRGNRRRQDFDDDGDDFGFGDDDDGEGASFFQSEDGGVVHSEPVWADDGGSTKKIGTKKLRKLQEKAEKRAMAEEERQEREDRKERQALLEQQRKKDEEQQKIEKAKRDEEERLRREEQERKEHEEYLKMKEMFSVEEEGEVGIVTEEESQSLLQNFIDHIKESKVVMLEELAAKFDLRTQEAIDRIETLLEAERLTGVMDDRGKFIYISEEELKSVAKYIRQRGRIAISDLAESSNSLINMKSALKQQPEISA